MDDNIKYGILYKSTPEKCLEYIRSEKINPKQYIILHQNNKSKWAELLNKPVDKDNIIGITQETLAQFHKQFKGLPDFPESQIIRIIIRCYKFDDPITTACKIVLRKRNISDEIIIKINKQVCELYSRLEKE